MRLDEVAACRDSLDFCGIGMLPDYWHCARKRVLGRGLRRVRLALSPLALSCLQGLATLGVARAPRKVDSGKREC
jgi:hypothetical protein